jgi:hypothetical protein
VEPSKQSIIPPRHHVLDLTNLTHDVPARYFAVWEEMVSPQFILFKFFTVSNYLAISHASTQVLLFYFILFYFTLFYFILFALLYPHREVAAGHNHLV